MTTVLQAEIIPHSKWPDFMRDMGNNEEKFANDN